MTRERILYVKCTNEPLDVRRTAEAVEKRQGHYDRVIFVGSDPCLYFEQLLACIELIREHADLKISVRTTVPLTMAKKAEKLPELMQKIDCLQICPMHHNERLAQKMRQEKTPVFDRQKFYQLLPDKHKIQVCVAPAMGYIESPNDYLNFFQHYQAMGYRHFLVIRQNDDKLISWPGLTDRGYKQVKSFLKNDCSLEIERSNSWIVRIFSTILGKIREIIE